MNKEKIKSQILAALGKLQSVSKSIFGALLFVPKYIFSKKRARAWELIIFSILQYIFLPILCGFLTAGILANKVLERFGLDRFSFANFPTIQVQGSKTSTYPGLMLVAGLGCVLGLLLSRILKFGARLGHFDFISPPTPTDAMAPPSVTGLIKSIIRLVGIPVIIVLGAVTALELSKTGLLPAVNIDTEYLLFEVDLTGKVVVAALGCLLMFLFDMILTTLLRMARRKDIEIKELR